MSSAAIAHRHSPVRLAAALLGSVIGLAVFTSGIVWAHQAIAELRSGDPAWGIGSILFALATPFAALVVFRGARLLSRPLLGIFAVTAASVGVAALSVWVWFGVAISHGVG